MVSGLVDIYRTAALYFHYERSTLSRENTIKLELSSGSFLQSDFFASTSFLIILKWKSHGCKLENTFYQVKSWLQLLDFSSSGVSVSNLNFMSHFQLDPKSSHQKVRQESSQLIFISEMKDFRGGEKKRSISVATWNTGSFNMCADTWFEPAEASDGQVEHTRRTCINCTVNVAVIRNENPGTQGPLHRSILVVHLCCLMQ